MTADTDSSPNVPKTRGAGFPTLSLSDAAEAVSSAGSYGRTHSLTAFAGYLGHSSTNSGPFRAKMAALRDWGFVEGRGETIRLTELAMQIAHPTSEDARLAGLRDAFSKSKAFESIYSDSAKGTDLSLELIANRAVTGLGVAASSKKRFAESFARSVVVAQLGELGANGTIRLIPPSDTSVDTPADEDEEQDTDPGVIDHLETKGARGNPRRRVQTTDDPPTIHQQWTVNGGTLLFEARLANPLSASAFGTLGEVVKAVEALVGAIGPGEPNSDTDAAE